MTARLLEDQRLIRIIGKIKLPGIYPKLPRPLQACFSPFIRFYLKMHLGVLSTVDQAQDMIVRLMERLVIKTTSGLSYSGTKHLQADKAYLFLSNHRDIAMDPALVIYALKQSGYDFVEIAIGDNLLSDPLVADLMRLNRSFTVHRDITGLKARLLAFRRLSDYIGQTLGGGRSIWLAQREGRAKDGIDKTDPAIVKMLHMSGKKRGLSFAEAMRELNIVPVALSYEYDPCDLLKAEEWQARKDEETSIEITYLKQEGEDIASIIRGITGSKGRVHIGFGQPLTGDFADAGEVAAEVDRQVATEYRLYPSNIAAFEQLKHSSAGFASLPEEVAHKLSDWASELRNRLTAEDKAAFNRQTATFAERIEGYPVALRERVLEMYANPLISQYRANYTDKTSRFREGG